MRMYTLIKIHISSKNIFDLLTRSYMYVYICICTYLNIHMCICMCTVFHDHIEYTVHFLVVIPVMLTPVFFLTIPPSVYESINFDPLALRLMDRGLFNGQ